MSGLKRIYEFVSCAGQRELKYGASRFIRIRPQPAPMGIDAGQRELMDRQIDIPRAARLHNFGTALIGTILVAQSGASTTSG
jgi:hypothetical protein